MDNLTKAFSLLEIGCWVFPAKLSDEGQKIPLTERGHLDASNDPEQVHHWFDGHPDYLVGVHAGRSGLVLLDRDIKYDENGNETKNGFQELEDSWLLADETFNYPSIRGNGQHDVYLAPENVVLNGQADYRGMKGVDRRAGSSWFVWAGDTVPNSRDEFAPAPEWLCDPAEIRGENGFEGSVEEWLDSLIPGEPNVLVRKAIDRIPDDMSHSDMVERQYEAVRLGAEGAPGVPMLLGAIHEAWMNRPEENHTTPKDQWEHKYAEALSRGIQLYGEHVERIRNLPVFNLSEYAEKLNTSLLTGESQDKYHFSRVLNALIKADLTDDERASVLWNAPTTRDLAHDWGIDFVYQRIEGAHKTPEPERENPSLESNEERKKATDSITSQGLLTPQEREYIATRPTFVNRYMAAAKASGLDNEVYARAGAWNVASMAFAFRGFIPQGPDKKMGVNLWSISLGKSGTGKAQPLHSLVLTPTGFKKMGDIGVGSQVITPSGDIARVSGVFPQGTRPVYRVTLKDGRTVEADENHLWSVRRPGTNGKRFVKTTQELKDNLYVGRNKDRGVWTIESISPTDFGTAWGCEIDPYSLGLLLGDGGLSSSAVIYTGTDSELLSHLRMALPEGMDFVPATMTHPDGISYRIVDRDQWGNRWGLELNRLGLRGSKAADKFIPEELKNTPARDRLALLQGLLDTDGTPAKNGNSVDFITASERLRDDIVWLVRSLGGRASVTTKDVQLKTWDEPRTYYRTYLTLPMQFDPFRLPRKLEKLSRGGKYAVINNPIRSIEFKGYEPTQCIMVDHPDHEYVTDGFVRTHNTSLFEFQESVLDCMFEGDNEDKAPYHSGADTSPQGLHLHLLERDRKPTVLIQDEASMFFEAIQSKSWISELTRSTADWYNGKVRSSSKISLKEYRGKTALTSFHVSMMGTPDDVLSLIDDSMFKTGFLARVLWDIAPPPTEEDEDLKYRKRQYDQIPDGSFDEVSPIVRGLVADLVGAVRELGDKPRAILADPESLDRMYQAHREMGLRIKGHPKWDILEPSVTRLGEDALRKCAAICAMYRGSSRIRMDDTLHALEAVEIWFGHLLTVVDQVGAGEFQKLLVDIEFQVARAGSLTETKILDMFRNRVKRDPRELSSALNFLVDSGRVNRKEESGKAPVYQINGMKKEKNT